MIYRLVKQVLSAHNKRIPEDYSVVCFDYSGSDWEEEGVTCSIHQGEKIGEQVATRLLKMIERKDCEEKNYSCILPPEIFEGRSILPVKK